MSLSADLDMGRILIDLSDDVIQRLENLKQLRNRPRAELLREAIEQYLDQQSSSVIRDALGLWGNQQEDGLEYERKLREEWVESVKV
ncbi:ribbon-helix-helix protein, CopG family, partial [Enterobacter asburiae]|uniref:ribbon-helix-helix protein, CopG family n=2 Tax=Enterobacter TaxID=547 RepID=UPI002965FA55